MAHVACCCRHALAGSVQEEKVRNVKEKAIAVNMLMDEMPAIEIHSKRQRRIVPPRMHRTSLW